MKLTALQVLSRKEIGTIHEATIGILEGCGVRVLSARMLAELESRGLRVDRERRLAFFVRSAIEDALSQVPHRLEVFDREGRFLYNLGGGCSRIAAGHNAVNWVDTQTGETRFSRVADVELFARLCEQLECIDMIGIPVMPQDVPDPQTSLLCGVRAVMENSRKPVYFSTDNRRVNHAVIEMCRAAFKGDLRNQVYGISQLSSTSPLYWEEGVLEAILDMLDTGVPIALLPEPIAGVSAPYTLAGLLTVHNAECLSGLAMIQLLRPGTRVMYGSSWTTSNMATGAALVGSVETSICRIAGTQLARHYGIPSHTTAPNSDNHAHDEQNAWEKTLSTFSAVAAGTDLVVNCGMFATGMTCSHEQLLMDEEIAACSLRLAAGLEVSEDTVAAELIRERGPQGETYLTAEHTLSHLRSGEYMKPRLSVSGPLAIWKEQGAKDTYALAKERVVAAAALQAPPFETIRHRAIEEIIAGFRL